MGLFPCHWARVNFGVSNELIKSKVHLPAFWNTWELYLEGNRSGPKTVICRFPNNWGVFNAHNSLMNQLVFKKVFWKICCSKWNWENVKPESFPQIYTAQYVFKETDNLSKSRSKLPEIIAFNFSTTVNYQLHVYYLVFQVVRIFQETGQDLRV